MTLPLPSFWARFVQGVEIKAARARAGRVGLELPGPFEFAGLWHLVLGWLDAAVSSAFPLSHRTCTPAADVDTQSFELPWDDAAGTRHPTRVDKRRRTTRRSSRTAPTSWLPVSHDPFACPREI